MLMLLVIVVSAVWVAVDAAQVTAKTGRRPWDQHPAVWAIGVVMAWVVVVPLYVHHRRRCLGLRTRVSVIGVIGMLLGVAAAGTALMLALLDDQPVDPVLTIGLLMVMGGFLAGGARPAGPAAPSGGRDRRR